MIMMCSVNMHAIEPKTKNSTGAFNVTQGSATTQISHLAGTV